jgi:BirA family biotin operon repressor/biotin-[acetyl-CoA-carboxylase] ligase
MERIDDLLKTRWLGRNYRFETETTSTNTLCYEMAEAGAPMGTVVVAKGQSVGRGRQNRLWVSPDDGLWFSLLLRPAFSPQEAAALTIITAVGICRGLMYYPGLGAQIKWPNDIYSDGKKLCGILSEMKADPEKLHYVVIGIGVNFSVAQLPADIQKTAAGIEEILGVGVDKKELLCRLLLGLESAYDQYFNGQKEELFAEWEERSLLMNRDVIVKTVGGDVEGKVAGLSADGFLLLDIGNGKGVKIISGDLFLKK